MRGFSKIGTEIECPIKLQMNQKKKKKKKKDFGNKFLGKTADNYNTFSVYILEEISNLLFGLHGEYQGNWTW